MCTCVARAPCTIISQALHHRIAIVEKYQVSRFASLAQRFPKVEVHMQMHSARAYHVHCALCHETTCIIELRSSNSISVPNLLSIGQNFPEPEDPSRINFSSPGARSLHPTGTVGWGSIHMTCKFGTRGVHRLTCRGGKRTTGAKYLHVHCTCTMLPTHLSHTAPSRPCPGVPMYRVWCP